MDHTIAGLPVSYYSNADGLYTSVLFQSVVIEGSPLVVHFDPPVAGIEGTGVPAVIGLAQALLGTLR